MRFRDGINDVVTVNPYYLRDSVRNDFACGKCKAIISYDEAVCPVCGVFNDMESPVVCDTRDVFKQV